MKNANLRAYIHVPQKFACRFIPSGFSTASLTRDIICQNNMCCPSEMLSLASLIMSPFFLLRMKSGVTLFENDYMSLLITLETPSTLLIVCMVYTVTGKAYHDGV